MSDINPADLREGDEITVRAKFKRHLKHTPGWVEMRAGVNRTPLTIPLSDIATHQPRLIAVGDWVKYANHGAIPRLVKAIDGDEAWITAHPDVGGNTTVRLSSLTRVDPPYE